MDVVARGSRMPLARVDVLARRDARPRADARGVERLHRENVLVSLTGEAKITEAPLPAVRSRIAQAASAQDLLAGVGMVGSPVFMRELLRPSGRRRCGRRTTRGRWASRTCSARRRSRSRGIRPPPLPEPPKQKRRHASGERVRDRRSNAVVPIHASASRGRGEMDVLAIGARTSGTERHEPIRARDRSEWTRSPQQPPKAARLPAMSNSAREHAVNRSRCQTSFRR